MGGLRKKMGRAQLPNHSTSTCLVLGLHSLPSFDSLRPSCLPPTHNHNHHHSPPLPRLPSRAPTSSPATPLSTASRTSTAWPQAPCLPRVRKHTGMTRTSGTLTLTASAARPGATTSSVRRPLYDT